jgi:hypothetical protein
LNSNLVQVNHPIVISSGGFLVSWLIVAKAMMTSIVDGDTTIIGGAELMYDMAIAKRCLGRSRRINIIEIG